MKKLLCSLSALLLCLSLSTCAYIKKPEPNYDRMLVEAVASLDREAGMAAAELRNRQAEKTHSDEPSVNYDDLLLLARLIQVEAGDPRFSDELRFCVGEVVLNRVASPEYPDTLREVVYQYGQYPAINCGEFEVLRPNKTCARIALRLLKGERMLEPQVLFQATYRIGPIYAKYYDRKLDETIYFCESMRSDLYEAQPMRMSSQP